MFDWNIEQYVRCPISMDILCKDKTSYPVILPDGYTYQLNQIIDWLQISNQSPITRELFDLDTLQLIPNYIISNISYQFHNLILQINQINQTHVFIPNLFFCPLSHKLLIDPIVAPNGLSYDKYSYIQTYQQFHCHLNITCNHTHNDTTFKFDNQHSLNFTHFIHFYSKTNFNFKMYYPNIMLKSLIHAFIDQITILSHNSTNTINDTYYINIQSHKSHTQNNQSIQNILDIIHQKQFIVNHQTNQKNYISIHFQTFFNKQYFSFRSILSQNTIYSIDADVSNHSGMDCFANIAVGVVCVCVFLFCVVCSLLR